MDWFFVVAHLMSIGPITPAPMPEVDDMRHWEPSWTQEIVGFRSGTAYNGVPDKEKMRGSAQFLSP